MGQTDPLPANALANECRTPEEKLIVWVLLDTGLRVLELCGLRPENIAWQSRELRVKGKGGPHAKQRAVPMSKRVRVVLEPYFAYKRVVCRRAPGPETRKKDCRARQDHARSNSARASTHVRDLGAAEGHLACRGEEDARSRPLEHHRHLSQSDRQARGRRVRGEMVSRPRVTS